MAKSKISSLLAWTLVCFSLSACQSVVRTDIATFRDEKASQSVGTIRVTTQDEAEPSLEFRYFKDKLENRLRSAGYTPVENEDAQYVARLGYSVSRQEKDDPHSRVFVGGHIGYGRYYPSSTILLSDSGGAEFEYVRELSLLIDKPVDNSEPHKVVQVKATSIGKCEHLTVVYDEMLEAIFGNLMRPDGSVEKVSIKGASRCP